MVGNIFVDKHAVVSGASGTIGSAIAARIVAEGGTVTMIGRREEPLKKAVAKLGEDKASYLILDVGSEEEVDRFATGLDAIDVLVCCAGWTVQGPVQNTPVSDAVDMFNTRFFGQCRLVKSSLPKFSDGGIILLCSGVGNTAFYPYYAYGSAVAGAIEAFAHHLAGELAPRKIQVNVISPGWTVAQHPDPDRAQRAVRGHTPRKEYREQFMQALDSPMHEIIKPEEFADALVFIARARHYTGQVIRLDAGRSTTDKPNDGHVDPMSFAPQG